ncbi:MAG: MBL fold metallo-hydrolase [Pseudomonadota bacterium]
MKVTVLGCGTSHGVPRIGGYWGDCDPEEPKNRRRRVSLTIEEGGTRLLFDTTPDLREQLLDANIAAVDAVFYTHDHADHCHGIDDLRGLFHAMKRQVDVYADARTLDVLKERFGYVFKGAKGYPAIAQDHVLDVGKALEVGPMTVDSFWLNHGAIQSVGYRVANVAYTTDFNGIPADSERFLEDLDVWVVDALRRTPHPTHPHLDLTLEWIDRFKPARAYLTHMAWDMDYQTLCKELPPHIRPAYDGLDIIVS